MQVIAATFIEGWCLCSILTKYGHYSNAATKGETFNQGNNYGI